MIKYLKRKEVDIEKYDKCIHESINSRIYAYSWYLDIVAEKQWDLLVLGDYEAVMPLPWRRRLGVKYVYPPDISQQLGVFSKRNINVECFIKLIPKRFVKKTIYFNANNQLAKSNIYSERINYIISLDKKYEEIQSKYRKDRRKSLRKAIENGLFFTDDFNLSILFKIHNEAFSTLNYDQSNIPIIRQLITYCNSTNKGFQRNIFNEDKQIICSAYFLKYNNRVYYIFGASNNEGKKLGATTFLIDSVLKSFSSTNYVFDFEGSTVNSIGSFYKSFGAEKEIYHSYVGKVF